MTHRQAKLLKVFLAGLTVILLWGFFALALRLANPQQSYLTLEISSSATSTAQVFYDAGHGFNEGDSSTQLLAATRRDQFQRLKFALPARILSHFRFDPSLVEGSFVVRNMTVSGPSGALRRIEHFDVGTSNQIRRTSVQNGVITLDTVPQANDPQLELRFDPPIDCSTHDSRYLLLLILDGLLLSLAIYLVGVDFLTTRRRFWNPEYLYALLILTVLLTICFWPAILGDRTLLDSAQDGPSVMSNGAFSVKTHTPFYKILDPGAPAWQTEPLLAVVRHIYESERVAPLWNPYQGFGVPLAADMHSQPFTPLIAPLLVKLTPRTYNFFILGRLLLAGFGCYLYLRLFLSFPGAIAGGIVTTLGGYYILFLTLPHLSVEILLSFGFYAAEMLLRKGTYATTLGLTALIFLTIVGGMPESTALLLVFVYSYSLFRIISDKALRQDWKKHVTRFGMAAIGGIALSAFLLLPFVEYVRHSFNIHELRTAGTVIGLYADPIGPAIFTYVFPLLFGPPVNSAAVFTGTRNYFGLIPLVFIFVAASRLFVWKLRSHRLIPITFFFSAAVLLLVLKRFGFEWVNDLGALPILSMIVFPKYEEALMTVSGAILCGIGIEYLVDRSISQSGIRRALAGGFLFLLITVSSCAGILGTLLNDAVKVTFVVIALGVPILVLFLAVFAVWHYQGQRKRLAAVMIVLIGAELSFNYVVPQYQWLGDLPYASENPYQGAPFVDFLKKRISNEDRMFGRGQLLYPDWASAFGLSDIRDLDALFYRKYLPFLRNFLTPPPGADELWTRFTGDAAYDFSTPKEQRLLQLSSARYLITGEPFPAQDRPFKLVYKQEALVYEFDDVLPRAALYFHAEKRKGEADILKRLAEPSLDIFSDVVLDGQRLSRAETVFVEKLNERTDVPRVQAARIRKYDSRDVELTADSDRCAILVLNDSEYPGWQVTVDGKEQRILPANYMFRGILLGPGKHSIRFTYDPATFRTGTIISGLTLLLMSAGWFVARRQKQAAETAAEAAEGVDRNEAVSIL